MPVKATTLKVHPNPWLFIDHLGRPAGRVAVEQPKGFYDSRTVGSRIKQATLVQKGNGGQLDHDIHNIEIEYDVEPVVVANSQYYQRRVMAGELIAADRESFAAAGGKPKDYEEHKKHLDSKRAEAIAEFEAANGDGAFKMLADQREAAAKLAEAVAKSAAGEPEEAPKPAPQKPAESKKGDV